MSKPITLSSIMSTLFPGSDKVISEKLSAEEHQSFAAEVQELNNRLDAQETGNALVVADLATANASIATLTEQFNTATVQLTTVTAERDKYKTQHEKAASKGDKDPDEDSNSRGTASAESYNMNAVEIWKKSHRQ